MNIFKRGGTEVPFDKSKIVTAILKANNAQAKECDKLSNTDEMSEKIASHIADDIEGNLLSTGSVPNVEDVQDMVEEFISKRGKFKLAKSYAIYRYEHELLRKKNTTDDKILSLLNRNNEEINQENANKNPIVNSTQRDYMAGEVSKDLARRYIYPEDLMKAHDAGIIHLHDQDYQANTMTNCCLINMEDMLQNGTIISGTKIDKPKSFDTACNIATQILAQIASNQFGGQTINIYHLVPFVDISRQKIKKSLIKEFESVGIPYDEDKINKITENRLKEEIRHGVQTIQYQILTLMTTNGQTPFCSIFIYLDEAETPSLKKDYAMVIEEILKQRILGVKNQTGIYIAPTFPKILYVLEPDNIEDDGEYYYLTKLAAECSAKRMVPDYMSEKKLKELKEGNVFGTMGCRSLLSVWKDPETGKAKFWGRFNSGVCTINLPDVALSVMDDMLGEHDITEYTERDMSKFENLWSTKQDEIKEKFWKLLDERLKLVYDAQIIRHKRLRGVPSDVAPILWQHGALARLKPGETIDKLLFDGYSTISLGYVGLYETVKSLTGKSQMDPSVKDFALSIVKHMKDICDSWNKIENIGFSVYGTPEESTTYKFAKSLRKRHGIIKDITDKDYVMNSYHTDVKEKVNAFDKLTNESPFQDFTTGGAISYVEVPNMTKNIEAVLAILKHIYNTTVYAEINCKLDCCQKCGYMGEISLIRDSNNKLIWKCPQCGNTDQNSMNIIRRVCGYMMNANVVNQGRLNEFENRVLHL